MAKIIEAKIIEAKVAKEFASTFLADKILQAAVNAVVDNAPGFDLVRCKDCKHFNMRYMECDNPDVATDNEGGADFSINFGLDDFCSYGERKNDV